MRQEVPLCFACPCQSERRLEPEFGPESAEFFLQLGVQWNPIPAPLLLGFILDLARNKDALDARSGRTRMHELNDRVHALLKLGEGHKGLNAQGGAYVSGLSGRLDFLVKSFDM